MTMVTHEQPWITVTRHRTMHATAEQRPPKVGQGRACQIWWAVPGLYSARLQESYSSIATNTTKPKDKKKNKTKKINKKNYNKDRQMCQYLGFVDNVRRAHYLVEQLDKLDIEEFTNALEPRSWGGTVKDSFSQR
jgi:hypothetical protein